MDNTVAIIFKGNEQPEVLYNVKFLGIKFGVITVEGSGYQKIYFKDDIKDISIQGKIRMSIR